MEGEEGDNVKGSSKARSTAGGKAAVSRSPCAQEQGPSEGQTARSREKAHKVQEAGILVWKLVGSSEIILQPLFKSKNKSKGETEKKGGLSFAPSMPL